MDFTFFTPWHQVLPREAGHVVACAGGRGRRALLAAIGTACAESGVGVRRCGPDAADPGDGVVVVADAGGSDEVLLPHRDTAAAWPARTSLAVLEVAAGAVGGRVDAAFGGGPPPDGLEPWTILDWERLQDHALARAAAVPPGVPVVLALTGLEDQPDSIGLFGFTGRMMADPRLAVVLFCSAVGDGLSVRACCRAEPA